MTETRDNIQEVREMYERNKIGSIDEREAREDEMTRDERRDGKRQDDATREDKMTRRQDDEKTR